MPKPLETSWVMLETSHTGGKGDDLFSLSRGGLLDKLQKAAIRLFVFPFWLLDARKKYNWIAPQLNADDEILELGSGMGSMVQILRSRRRRVAAIDVADHSVRNDLRPTLYDGVRLPVRKRDFDVCLLSTVLHHCSQPDEVLREALRVSRKVIIIEDIYDTPWRRALTHCLDSILNWEFVGHPHSNRTDEEWKEAFKAHGATLTDAKVYNIALLFRQAVYVILPKDNAR